MSTGALLAHQGGWDEILFVLAPLVVFAGLLVAARRRVDQLDGDVADDDADDDAGQDVGRPPVTDTP